MACTKTVKPPEVGDEAPEFVLPAAQGGQLHLSRRIVHGPVIVVFYRGAWSEECVEYFKALSGKEREINVAGGTVVGIGAVEPDEAREFVRACGIGSYVLYDYIRTLTRSYGLLEKDAEHGDSARPAVFLVDSEGVVRHAWLDERPPPEDLLASVSEITGLPKEPEEEESSEEKPKKPSRKTAKSGEAGSEKAAASESAENAGEASVKSEAASGEEKASEKPASRERGGAPSGEGAGETAEVAEESSGGETER